MRSQRSLRQHGDDLLGEPALVLLGQSTRGLVDDGHARTETGTLVADLHVGTRWTVQHVNTELTAGQAAPRVAGGLHERVPRKLAGLHLDGALLRAGERLLLGLLLGSRHVGVERSLMCPGLTLGIVS